MSKTILFPQLLKASEFAKMKDVSTMAVYKAIKEGRIEVTYVGKSSTLFIDGNKYKHFEFKKI